MFKFGHGEGLPEMAKQSNKKALIISIDPSLQ
jgi:hypothetical protein